MTEPGRALTLRSKALIGMAVMLLPAAALLASSLSAFQRLFSAVEEIVAEVADEIQPLHQLQSLLLEPARAVRDYVLHGEPESGVIFQDAKKRVDQAFEHARETLPFARVEERDLLRAAHEQWRATSAIGARIVAGSHADMRLRGSEYVRFEEHLARLERLFPMMLSLARQEVEEERHHVAAELDRVRRHVGAIFALGLGAALFVGTLLRRSILAPLRGLQEGAQRFGGGDLSFRIPLTGPAELQELARGFNVMAGKLQEGHSELLDLSVRDPLTRLFNRREFFARLGTEVERARRGDRPLSLLMVDVDRFKAVNDTYGHPAGDAALRGIAEILRSAVRPSDTVARYGGEEFAVLLPDTPLEGGASIGRRLATAVASQALSVGRGERLALTVSVGVASLPSEAATAEELLAAADAALYRAKRGGRNRLATLRDPVGEPHLHLVPHPGEPNPADGLGASGDEVGRR